MDFKKISKGFGFKRRTQNKFILLDESLGAGVLGDHFPCPFIIKMETSIKIKEKTKKNLNLKKYTLGFKSINEVIQKMYDLITKHKMWDELKGVKK